jgi:hypothetical protein
MKSEESGLDRDKVQVPDLTNYDPNAWLLLTNDLKDNPSVSLGGL